MDQDTYARIRGRVAGSYAGSGWRQAMSDSAALLDEVDELRRKNTELRTALEQAPGGHDEACTHINKHPYPDSKDCRCWQKTKHDALGVVSEGYRTRPKEDPLRRCLDCGEEHHLTFMPHHLLNCPKKVSKG